MKPFQYTYQCKDWAERRIKDKARELAVRFASHPKKHVIMMPGPKAICVERAIHHGLIDRNTQCIFVERDCGVWPVMENTLTRLSSEYFPIQYHLHRDVLHRLELKLPVDYCFFDFCGSLTVEFVLWVHLHLSKKLATNADVAITLWEQFRANQFAHSLMDYLESPEGSILLGDVPKLPEYMEHRRLLQYSRCLQLLFHSKSYNQQIVRYTDYENEKANMGLFLLSDMKAGRIENAEHLNLFHRVMETFYRVIIKPSRVCGSALADRSHNRVPDFLGIDKLKRTRRINLIMNLTPRELKKRTEDYRERGIKAWNTRLRNQQAAKKLSKPMAKRKRAVA